MELPEEYLFDEEKSITGKRRWYGATLQTLQNKIVQDLTTTPTNSQPRDYLCVAILTTLFCFFPFGCLSIYYSFKTRSYYRQGRLRRSITASKHSQTMAQFACIVGVMVWFSGVITLLMFIKHLL